MKTRNSSENATMEERFQTLSDSLRESISNDIQAKLDANMDDKFAKMNEQFDKKLDDCFEEMTKAIRSLLKGQEISTNTKKDVAERPEVANAPEKAVDEFNGINSGLRQTKNLLLEFKEESELESPNKILEHSTERIDEKPKHVATFEKSQGKPIQGVKGNDYAFVCFVRADASLRIEGTTSDLEFKNRSHEAADLKMHATTESIPPPPPPKPPDLSTLKNGEGREKWSDTRRRKKSKGMSKGEDNPTGIAMKIFLGYDKDNPTGIPIKYIWEGQIDDAYDDSRQRPKIAYKCSWRDSSPIYGLLNFVYDKGKNWETEMDVLLPKAYVEGPKGVIQGLNFLSPINAQLLFTSVWDGNASLAMSFYSSYLIIPWDPGKPTTVMSKIACEYCWGNFSSTYGLLHFVYDRGNIWEAQIDVRNHKVEAILIPINPSPTTRNYKPYRSRTTPNVSRTRPCIEQHPTLRLEDKSVFRGGSIDRPLVCGVGLVGS